MRERCFVGVAFTPVSRSAAAAVSGFLRYVQYRDQHPVRGAAAPAPKVDGLLKYVAHRDRSVARGLLFDADGPAGDDQRRALSGHIRRACATSRALTYRGRDGKLRDRRRAVYRFVISPERATGLDLQQLTRAVMRQLADNAGVERLRWIAAQHRNTAHPHVHVVLAGIVETKSGGYRPLLLTKRRLALMKESIGMEIDRQRGVSRPTRRTAQRGARSERRRVTGTQRGWGTARTLLRRAARHYRWQLELEAALRERQERQRD